MGKYTISMDYNEFNRLQERKKELEELKKRITDCVEYRENSPIIVHTKDLKNIALELLPFDIKEGDIIIDV